MFSIAETFLDQSPAKKAKVKIMCVSGFSLENIWHGRYVRVAQILIIYMYICFFFFIFYLFFFHRKIFSL